MGFYIVEYLLNLLLERMGLPPCNTQPELQAIFPGGDACVLQVAMQNHRARNALSHHTSLEESISPWRCQFEIGIRFKTGWPYILRCVPPSYCVSGGVLERANFQLSKPSLGMLCHPLGA